MEDVQETKHETLEKDSGEKISEHQTDLIEDNQLQQQKIHEQEVKQIEIPGEKQQQQQQQQIEQQQPQTFNYDQDGEDEEYEDDDEEKETSQKLVIDIPEEEEEKDEEDDDVIALDDLPPQDVPPNKETEKCSPKPEKVDAVITLSDGEEDVGNDEAISKPGKVQKRRSMGAGAENEDHLRLKRRKINVAGAPKLPLTGYLRYLNDRREAVRKEHPTKTHTEHNKMIGEEWHALPADVKNSYLKAADVEKQRYVKELQSFLKSRPDILASELAKNKIRKNAENNSPNPAASSSSTGVTKQNVLKDNKAQINDSSKTMKDNIKDKIVKEIVSIATTSQHANDKLSNEKTKRKRTPTPPSSNTNVTTSTSAVVSASTSTSSSSVNAAPGEIPIFTNEFLEHNKIYDMELRSIRKSKTDLEQQNSVLEKHVENMKFGVEKMITENNELEEKNRLLEIYLDKLKRKLALALSTLPLPTAPNGATMDNIEKYMQDLYKMSTSNSTGPATLNKAKDIIRKLDLQIQL